MSEIAKTTTAEKINMQKVSRSIGICTPKHPHLRPLLTLFSSSHS